MTDISERDELCQLIWDMYKDVTGIRPRHMDMDSMSIADLRREVKYLDSQMEEAIERDLAWEDQIRAWKAEEEAFFAARQAEQPLPIDYYAARYQDGWI